MSDFDYSLDIEEDHTGPRGCGPGWGNFRPQGNIMSRRGNSIFRNSQYGDAYGDYRGGYGPGGGFGPPRMRPYPPRGPPPLMGPGGYGPIRPPLRRGPGMHRGAQFLYDCEINPQYIKNLPYELLDTISPDYCGLCALNLDSFAAAKIHYNCKNHYKAQKKFMAQYNPAKNPNEIVPMKARNLYCELCDVHITSAPHADSHYAGKSHRAIVEGRKPPRNPALLQDGMEGRTEALIRREKKNAPKKPETPAVEPKPVDNKVVPPELICEICKTSVTCSEQMTNHLNGKKHLSKEKQHILKMMKGRANDSDEAKDCQNEEGGDEEGGDEEGGDEEDDNEEHKNEEEKQQPTSEAVDEWGNGGGGDWDAQN